MQIKIMSNYIKFSAELTQLMEWLSKQSKWLFKLIFQMQLISSNVIVKNISLWTSKTLTSLFLQHQSFSYSFSYLHDPVQVTEVLLKMILRKVGLWSSPKLLLPFFATWICAKELVARIFSIKELTTIP